MRLGAFVLGLGLLLNAATASAARVNYAIVIGNNQRPSGHPELKELRYADDDAARFYELFRRAGPDVVLLATVDSDTARRFSGLASRSEPPTSASVERAIASFREKMQRDIRRGDTPVLFLTFSGHGAEDASGRYALTLLDGGITRDYLLGTLLSAIPKGVTVHFIFDACRAAGVLEARGAFGKEREGIVASLDESERELLPRVDLADFPNVGALVASSGSEDTYEWSRIQSGVFTHVVVSGLLGAADINGDRRIEYSEIEAFVASATRGIRDPRAPRLRVATPMGGSQRVLVDLDRLQDTVLLQGDPKGLGRLSVQLENGLYWLEANVNTSRVTLALPARGQAVLRAKMGETLLDTTRTRHLALEALAFQPPSLGARGGVPHPWEKGLFSFPYDRGYYQGFADSQGIDQVDFITGPSVIDKRRIYEGGTLGPTILGGVGVALLTTAVVTGYVAWSAKRDFEATSYQRSATEANDRYQTFGSVSAVTGVAGVVAGSAALAWWLFPSAEPDASGRTRWAVRATATW